MGVWNEAEARQRHDDTMKRKLESQRAKDADEIRRTSGGLNGSGSGIAARGRERGASVTIFDAHIEEERYRKSLERPIGRPIPGSTADGFDNLTISPTARRKPLDPSFALTVLRKIKSVRGCARLEYGKVHGALGFFYDNIVESDFYTEPILFLTYQDPLQQAQVLANLKIFARSDSVQGWRNREERLDSRIATFEDSMQRDFEQGYESRDAERMKRYAHVLVLLNGGAAVINVFIQSHPFMQSKEKLGNPLECLDGVASNHVDLGPSRRFFERLAAMLNEQAALIDQVFPASVDVLLPFMTRVCEEVLPDYINSLFGVAHEKSIETYLKAVSGVFEQCMRFAISVQPTKASSKSFADEVKGALAACFEPHMDLYMKEELDFFTGKSEEEVSIWEKQLSEQEAKAESYFMSNVNRQAVKRDFLSSFKKVVMMPVNVLPAFPMSGSRSTSAQLAAEVSNEKQNSRSPTPGLTNINTPDRTSTPSAEAPTSELAANAAIMNSRLEGIKSLFSIEVALNLIHYAKSSLERAAIFVRMGGPSGERAKQESEAIFISLLRILGERHIQGGFDKAVGHLSSYNPHDVKSFKGKPSTTDNIPPTAGLEPLVIFLELVNVGDLIQQMVDVFYAQELVATRLTDRDDFLNPAGKAKKRFESMLDERVAAGMSKGIDVLMDEVEFICATTQVATDFNPGADKSDKGGMIGSGIMDIGPTTTATQVVQTIGSHTSMLVGSTDKNMLDVFNQEVGLRLFGVLCKHIKRQRISVDGAIKLIRHVPPHCSLIGIA